MKSNQVIIPSVAVAVLFTSYAFGKNQEKISHTEIQKPNIIFILADDLGYGDLGVYGQTRIETPNIDRLAATGILFSQHYCGSPVSAPSRCALLTGKHTGHAQIRGNDEWGERGDVWNYRAMIADSTLEGQHPLETGTATIARLLQMGGYKTGMMGKWGLGAPQTGSIPTKMGFDYFFGINCQRMAHTYYPVFLYENDHRYYLNNDTVPPGTRLPRDADPLDTASFSAYTSNEYAPEIMFTKMIDFVNDNKDHPFFLYWATPIPHVALQAPIKWVDHYTKKFGDEKPYLGDKGYFPQRYPHAAYAAMISYLDEQVGLLVKQLKDLGIYENTLIIFTSDNGPSYEGGTDSPWFDSGGPFKSEYGWAKGFTHEGGIRVPMIASWPEVIKPGSISDHISAFWDVLPTLCEIAGVRIPYDTDGISFLPALLGKKQKKHKYLYWEFPASGGQQAVRMGKWKGIRENIISKENMKIELFNLDNDIREQNDVSKHFPDIVEQMEKIMVNEHISSTNNLFKMRQLGDQ